MWKSRRDGYYQGGLKMHKMPKRRKAKCVRATTPAARYGDRAVPSRGTDPVCFTLGDHAFRHAHRHS